MPKGEGRSCSICARWLPHLRLHVTNLWLSPVWCAPALHLVEIRRVPSVHPIKPHCWRVPTAVTRQSSEGDQALSECSVLNKCHEERGQGSWQNPAIVQALQSGTG